MRLNTPQPLFDLRTIQSTGEVVMYEASNNIAVSYDVLPDGRFLMQRRTEPAAARELILVQNWFDELRRTLPGK